MKRKKLLIIFIPLIVIFGIIFYFFLLPKIVYKIFLNSSTNYQIMNNANRSIDKIEKVNTDTNVRIKILNMDAVQSKVRIEIENKTILPIYIQTSCEQLSGYIIVDQQLQSIPDFGGMPCLGYGMPIMIGPLMKKETEIGGFYSFGILPKDEYFFSFPYYIDYNNKKRLMAFSEKIIID